MARKKLPNILFKIEGGKKVGLGHIYRSFELSKQFIAEGTGNPFFYTNYDPNSIHSSDEQKIESTVFLSDKEGIAEINELKEIIKEYDIDIVIFDQRSVISSIVEAFKKENSKTMLVALDYFVYNQPVDLIINLFNQNTTSEPKLGDGYFEGVEFAIIREAFREYHDIDRAIGGEVTTVVITFGGADPNCNTLKTLVLLNEINKKLTVNIVLGRSFADRASITQFISKSRHECKIVSIRNSFEHLIYSADLGFCGGGTTQLEFCSVGTPLIIYPQTIEEERFARYMEGKGACRVISDSMPASDMKILIEETMKKAEIRCKMSAIQKNLIDLEGKKRITNVIISKYNSLRRNKECLKEF